MLAPWALGTLVIVWKTSGWSADGASTVPEQVEALLARQGIAPRGPVDMGLGLQANVVLSLAVVSCGGYFGQEVASLNQP